MIRICLAGATGVVGRALVPAIRGSKGLRLVSAVSRSNGGRDLGLVLGIPGLSLTISPSVAEALETKADVLVDFTSPGAVRSHVLLAVRNGVNVVIGTSGLTDADHREVDREAKKHKVGVVAAGNFAVSAVLAEYFALTAAKYLHSWEIIEYALDTKPDAPSGTSRELVHALSGVRRPKVLIPVGKTYGDPRSRGSPLDGTQIHSVRLPGPMVGIEAIFGREGERLTIRHEAGRDAGPYVNGVLLAIRKAPTFVGLKQGLWKIMDV